VKHVHWTAILSIAGFAAALAGCQSQPRGGQTFGGKVPTLDSSSAAAAGFSTEQSDEAVRLYTAKCMRCHKSYDPASYPDRQWNAWMSKMSRKAKLRPPDEELLSSYLQAYRAATIPASRP
jgi:hypothetical protein